MRNIINTIANVTTGGIAANQVRTVMAGVVDVLRAAPRHLHLYAAPASGWSLFGKPKQGLAPEQLSCSRRESGHCRPTARHRRPRESSCLRRFA
jgi:hypothetical protein